MPPFRAIPTHRTQPHLAGLLAGLVLCVASATACAAPPVRELVAPPGFRVELLTDAVPAAREMAWSPRGILYVGTREGRVHAFVMRDGRIVARHVVATGLDMPVGVAYRDGTLFISAVSRILRIEHIDDRLAAPPAPAVVTDALPTDHHHGWKFIAFGPDGKLYVPVGAPCNVCAADRNRYALIARMNADGSGREVFARGVRNTVGFAWHPDSGDLWFTDNGRDLMGDDLPDDELNRAPRAGLDFGFPYCHGGDTPDPEFGGPDVCRRYVPPVLKLGAHVAALGMRFYTGPMFPASYRNNIFIAEHGSWNRSTKAGYRVMRVVVSADGSHARQTPFVTGWLRADGSVWGRPADVLSLPDGSLLISDDYAGAIYRVTYAAP
ncbi:PQQ-dependent sugar dehydrogenase (plasmid) [Burkholderia vietnamiensis]|uniref:Glucose/sorbosone dehydrogenases-like protein n=1 Tax=Burkholderia vietnamiensis (strain G4 / LMG 22486) TaxID=269482 RepID=A4JCJ7_BURVG|nr:PQQ-dependent sugar dehydrogenase [Burkholderia vietnamiensis]ABO54000.1 glucose/sorbosone dehydrogenases-like protein [Burkholderia vietnamiensis G4]MCA8228864.1 PQQ-dependent sugar dehydrogenase [Burkholderia vietnamiensis]MCB4347125.1 PQQ-dependent sugar dehydrogenase [Burkholderia vietnamiensis]HDR9152539.1 sorbosone dehydrogenase family protein [Burkholderia vietnamiensis]